MWGWEYICAIIGAWFASCAGVVWYLGKGVSGFGWLWMAVDGCGWLWMAVDGCGWLWMMVTDCDVTDCYSLATRLPARCLLPATEAKKETKQDTD